jgi:hypothetical protein
MRSKERPRAARTYSTFEFGSFAGSFFASTSRDHSRVFHAGTGGSQPSFGTKFERETSWYL